MECICVLWRDTLESLTSHYQPVHLPQTWLKATLQGPPIARSLSLSSLSFPRSLNSIATDSCKFDAHKHWHLWILWLPNEIIFLFANNRLSKQQISLLSCKIDLIFKFQFIFFLTPPPCRADTLAVVSHLVLLAVSQWDVAAVLSKEDYFSSVIDSVWRMHRSVSQINSCCR